MERQLESELELLRKHLSTLEHNRRHAQRRDLFWDAKGWEETLASVIAEERRRDAEYLEAAHAAGVGTDNALAWLQALYDAVEHDVAWHHGLLATVETAVASSPDTAAATERLSHAARLTTALYAREVQLTLVAIEYLEGRRRKAGFVADGVWQRYWQAAQTAMQREAAAWEQRYGEAPPRWLRNERIDWCKRIYDLQQATAEAWQRRRDVDRIGWQADHATIGAALRLLQPSKVPGAFILGALVVVGLCLLLVVVAFKPAPAQPKMVPAAPGLAESAVELNDQGLALLVQGNCAAALPLFRAAAQRDPAFYEPPNNLAFCLFEQGDVAGAIAAWQQSLTLNAQNADAHAGLGMALYVQGKIDAGHAEFAAACRLNPRYADREWLKGTAKWSDGAIKAAAPLLAQAGTLAR